MRIKVHAYSGYKADERPDSITLGEKTLKVDDILDRWYGEGYDYFKLLTEDGFIYIIRYDRGLDEWELTMMEKADSDKM